MTGTGAEIRAAITEALSDGAWHDLIEVLHVGMKVVPPGIATRRNERDRANNYTSHGKAVKERTRQTSLDRQVMSGQRVLAREQLVYMHRTGKIEIDHYPSREDWHTPGAVKVRSPVEMPTVPPKKRVRAHMGSWSPLAMRRIFKRFKA